jgi:glycosyltransferase involved in cell wall biosynthesis
VPQVATAVGGVGAAVTAETGVLVPPGDPEALAGAIVEVLGDPERCADMSAASARRHAERFQLDRMVAATARLYETALGR